MTTNWKGSLGHVAERLRRSIAWTSAGTLDVQFDAPVIGLQPVVLADDATRPGTAGVNSPRNRRWMWPVEIEDVPEGERWWAGIATEGFLTGSRTQSNGVIVDQLHFGAEGECNIEAYIIPPGGALPTWITAAVVANTRGPIFVDGMRSATDWAPCWGATSGANDAGQPWGGVEVYRMGIGTQAGVVTGMPWKIQTEIYLQPGSCLIVGPGSAQIDGMDWQCTFFGRAF